jgi:hypothetical protein
MLNIYTPLTGEHRETSMSQLILMIARVDDLDHPEALTEVWRRAMPVAELSRMLPEHYLNGLESEVMEVGWEAMRTLLVEQWQLTDELLVRRFRQEHAGATVGDGYDRLKVASRLGVVHLPRQVCYLPGVDRHHLPGKAGWPEHEGQVTTRGLQEWGCLLPQELPFGTAARLLGWMTHDPDVLSETQSRRWVCRHGELIRQAEWAEVEALQKRSDLKGLKAQWHEAGEPRRAAAWAAELNSAVQTALAQADPKPPAGITVADWERVLEVRRTEPLAQAEERRCLGPEVQAGEVVASVDEIVVRRPEKRRFLELGTAFVRTASGYRYLSGRIELVVPQFFLLFILCGGMYTKITLLGDGARWISRFFQERLAAWPLAALLLDWYHCRKQCYDLTSLICRGRQAKADLLGAA